ncbi:DUF7507 domain-containing protein [Actinophytocola sp.]|uniref:DUF7507 domain-containing protein n=1 Tax=Actinophytocola sp. TaxID=1872138 RepID=UPI002ED4FFD4
MAKRSRYFGRLFLATILTATCAAALPGGPATLAAPGTPVGPGAPPFLVYAEGFESGSGVTEFESYLAIGVKYTADPYWLRAARCNGFVLSAEDVMRPAGSCNASDANYRNVRAQAQALGLLTDPANAAGNRAVSTLTSGNANSDVAFDSDGPLVPAVMFRTATQLALHAKDRFVTFSVDAAASSCQFTDPLLRFYLRNGAGVESPVSASALNPCTDPNRRTARINGVDVSYVSSVASSAMLLRGESYGIVVRNEALNSLGNDSAFDNLRLLDVSPKLDKAFSPTTVAVGGVSTLTMTVTNTTDLLAKNGWAFTDTLPVGLRVATPSGVGGTCNASTAATPGGSTITVTNGTMRAGQVSCTITVKVTSNTPGPNDPTSKSYRNCSTNLSNVVGLQPRHCAFVEYHSTPRLSVDKSVSPTMVTHAGQVLTYSFLVTNTGTATMRNIGVRETVFTGTGGVPLVSCPVSTLTPGARTTCTATYTVTQADVNAGGIRNTAEAYGTPPLAGRSTGSPSDTATVTVLRS